MKLEFSVKPMPFQFSVISNIRYNTFFLNPKYYPLLFIFGSWSQRYSDGSCAREDLRC